MNSIETVATITRIRQLIKTNGTVQTAKLVGRSKQNISNIKTGRRHANTGAATINDLELRKLASPKLCRCCSDPKRLFAKSGRCVECELYELAKQDVVRITVER